MTYEMIAKNAAREAFHSVGLRRPMVKTMTLLEYSISAKTKKADYVAFQNARGDVFSCTFSDGRWEVNKLKDGR